MYIKQSTLDSIDRYVNDKIATGGFLEAVLCNNLARAVMVADPENYAALKEIVLYIYNNCPSECHGSPEAVEKWLSK